MKSAREAVKTDRKRQLRKRLISGYPYVMKVTVELSVIALMTRIY